ncbi:MAG: redoxin family protein [Planctomycetes bacterium]|nr:redoxin family protein [Planctomycetota bacterium]
MRAFRTTLMLCALGAPLLAGDDDLPDLGVFREEALPVPSEGLLIGRWMPDVAFTDVHGESARLSDFALSPATVIVMRDTGCPLSKRYAPRLKELEQRFSDQAVTWIYVHPGRHQTLDDILEAAGRDGLHGRMVADPEQTFAAQLGARSTTEVFVLDAWRTLRYRGAVDDQYGVGFSRPAPLHGWLADALAQVCSMRDVAVPATTSPGCVLDLPEIEREPRPVTWAESVSRVMQDRCASCHHHDGPGHFAFDTYDEVVGRKGMIRYVLSKRLMPPWHAAAGSGPWRDDRSLSRDDRKLLLDWIAADCPEGDPADAPRARHHVEGRWQLGKPDAAYAMDEPIAVPADGVVDYRYVYVKTDQPVDRWVSAVEVLPGASTVVHHVLVFPADEDEALGRRRVRGSDGLEGYFAAYVPGAGTRVFGDGLAKRLPAGTWLKLQLHYTPDGTATEDVTRIGFHFADVPPAHEVHTSGVYNTDFMIPAGSRGMPVTAERTLERDTVLSAFSPHMHLRGAAFQLELELPDGEREMLLDVPRYDFEWQTMYTLLEPRTVPAGSKLIATGTFDNSAANPANPDPGATVRFGEQTTDEMMIAYFEWWDADAR